MLEITEDYAQKCYIYNKKWSQLKMFMMSCNKFGYPMNLAEYDRDVSASTLETGIFIIYENIGSGYFNFHYHGDRENFKAFLQMSNLQMTDKIDLQPAKCYADETKVRLNEVFTIRNTVPVRRIEPTRFTHKEMIPDIAVGKPVISNLAAIFTTPVNFAGSAPEYCPPIDGIDAEIERVDLALQKGRYCNQKQYEQSQYPPCKCSPPCPQRLLKKPNFRPSDSIVTKALELYSDLSDILDGNPVVVHQCGPSMQGLERQLC